MLQKVLVAATCAALMTSALHPQRARANDTSAALSVGGLVFAKTSEVSMESEELTITPETVTVRYRFLNLGQKPVTLKVAFPLPDIDLSDRDTMYAFPVGDPVNFVGFESKVDDQPVAFETSQRAILGGQDVTEAVRAAGMSLLPLGDHDDRIRALPQEPRERLIKDGLLAEIGTDDKNQPILQGTWTVQTSFVRMQTFPPGRAVTVEHRYRTSVGISLDTVLRKAVRESPGMADLVKRYLTDYCVPAALLRSLDKIAGEVEENIAELQERRINYVLRTGANWAGPIKDFRLIIDKGNPRAFVSFCGEGVTKTSPTSFEMRAKDFTPDRDLKILLITTRN